MKTQELTSNNLAAMSYLTVVGLLFAKMHNQYMQSEFVSFHIKQSIGITLLTLVSIFLGFIPFVGWLFLVVGLLSSWILWIIGLKSALLYKETYLPFLGRVFNQWF